jgi:hypothetical protein
MFCIFDCLSKAFITCYIIMEFQLVIITEVHNSLFNFYGNACWLFMCHLGLPNKYKYLKDQPQPFDKKKHFFDNEYCKLQPSRSTQFQFNTKSS